MAFQVDIPIWVIFKFEWPSNLSDILFCVTIYLSDYFILSDIPFLVTFHSRWCSILGDKKLFKHIGVPVPNIVCIATLWCADVLCSKTTQVMFPICRDHHLLKFREGSWGQYGRDAKTCKSFLCKKILPRVKSLQNFMLFCQESE